jgi:DNA-directed RNA polymerase subunit beta'
MTNIDLDARYERVNDITAVSIRLASPTDIRNWSYGEVTQAGDDQLPHVPPREGRPVLRAHLRPEKRLRVLLRQVQGHQAQGHRVRPLRREDHPHRACAASAWATSTLAAPVAHIWFFKAMPSRLGALLRHEDVGPREGHLLPGLRRHRPGSDTTLEAAAAADRGRVPRVALEARSLAFEAGMGAEAIRELLLEHGPADASKRELREGLSNDRVRSRSSKDLIKRLKIVETLRVESGNQPEWMILDVDPGDSAGPAAARAAG